MFQYSTVGVNWTRDAGLTCTTSEFTCEEGGCVDVRRRCDGRYDCRDGSDEFDCGNTTTLTYLPVLTVLWYRQILLTPSEMLHWHSNIWSWFSLISAFVAMQCGKLTCILRCILHSQRDIRFQFASQSTSIHLCNVHVFFRCFRDTRL